MYKETTNKIRTNWDNALLNQIKSKKLSPYKLEIDHNQTKVLIYENTFTPITILADPDWGQWFYYYTQTITLPHSLKLLSTLTSQIVVSPMYEIGELPYANLTPLIEDKTDYYNVQIRFLVYSYVELTSFNIKIITKIPLM